MSRPHVCLVSDPLQWGLLNAVHPAQGDAPAMADVTWIGLIRPEGPVPASAIRPLHDVSDLPDLPRPDPGEAAPAFAARLEAAKAERRAWIAAQGWESPEVSRARLEARGRRLLEGLVACGAIAGIAPDGTPLPHARRFSLAELGPGATMANVLVALGVFPSLTQARRNGQTAPLTLGRHVLTKKRLAVEIVP